MENTALHRALSSGRGQGEGQGSLRYSSSRRLQAAGGCIGEPAEQRAQSVAARQKGHTRPLGREVLGPLSRFFSVYLGAGVASESEMVTGAPSQEPMQWPDNCTVCGEALAGS